MESFKTREFRIRPEKSPGGEIREIILDQLVSVTHWLGRFEENRDEAIHELRKCGKRIRGVLRLAKPGLSEGDFRAADALARGYAKWFSEARDAFVLLETCGMVEEENKGIDLSTVREELMKSHRSIVFGEEMEQSVKEASRQLEMLRLMIERIPFDQLNKENLKEGRALLFAKGKRECRKAKTGKSEEDCHRWRKRAKYLSFHARLLGEPDAERFARLGSMLGSHHDLAVLDERVESVETEGVVSQMQNRLEESAFSLGIELFEAKA